MPLAGRMRRRALPWLLCAALVVSGGIGLTRPATAGEPPPSASAGAETLVKYYIVGHTGTPEREYLFDIAARTLGDGRRYMEIFELNKDRVQPDGQRMEDPLVLMPGWVLVLPDDAEGPGRARRPGPDVRPSARVAPGGAVDLVASDVTSPPGYRDMLAYNNVYILPVGWMPRCQIVATYRITLDRAVVRQNQHANTPLLLAPSGAAHGVPGLPVEAVRWPHARFRSAHRYVVVPDDAATPPGLPLWADRPTPTDGAVMVEVRVERNQAIDVEATAAALADLPAVRSTAPDLVARGVSVLLPASEFDNTVVRRAWRGDGDTWRSISLHGRAQLSSWLRRGPAD